MLALLLQSCSSGAGPSATIAAYLSAWSRRDYSAMAALVVRPPRDFVTFNRQVAADLDLERAAYRAGTATTNGSDATTPVTARLVLVPFGALEVRTTLHLTDAGGRWSVVWSPRSILPALGPGDAVSTTVTWPPRADIVGVAGAPLTVKAPMVTVGIEGSRITAAAPLTAALASAGATAAQTPYVPRTKAAGKSAMGEGVVQMIVHIAAAGVVTNPGLAVHMRSIGVAVLIAIVTLWVGSTRRAFVCRRPMRGGRSGLMRSTTRRANAPFMLGKRRNSKNEQSSKS